MRGENRKWRRPMRVAAALACTAGVAVTAMAAAGGVFGDLNADGKVTAYDAQLLVEHQANKISLDTEYADSLTLDNMFNLIFGRAGDGELENAKGQYEIWTVDGLQKMAEQPGRDYILMTDLDLEGAVWTPVASFSGSFDGNGKTISDFKIQSASGGCQGFFGTIEAGASVTNLNLADAALSAGNTGYVGVLAGNNKGTITDCTTTGKITSTSAAAYVGCIAGYTTGNITGGTGLTATAGSGTQRDRAEGLTSVVTLDVQTENVGLVGMAGSTASVTGLWQDTRNASALLSETEQARRETVVSYMYDMATVQWMPTKNMTYYPGSTASVHYQTFIPGNIYIGVPYNHANGSLERFLSCMDTGSGTATVKDIFSDEELYATYNSSISGSTEGRNTGWILYMGNDCSSAVGQAWQKVSPTRVRNQDETLYGGCWVRYTANMVPNAQNQQTYGILPVGNYVTGEYATTQLMFEANGAQAIAEAYAQAHRGDALVGFDSNGHARLLAYDPVIIRSADGTIDLNKSYCITHEQGDGLYQQAYDTPNSSCRVNYCYSLDALLNYESYYAAGNAYGRQMVGSKHRYVPITMRAFAWEEHAAVTASMANATLPAPYCTSYSTDPASENYVSAPNAGKLYSNYYVVSVTLNIRDYESEEVIWSKTAYNCVGTAETQYRATGGTVDLSRLFADYAQEAGLTSGQTYKFSVALHTSNGQTLERGRYNGSTTNERADLGEEIVTYYEFTA